MSQAILTRLGAIENRGLALCGRSVDLVSLARVPLAEGPVALARAFTIRRLAELVKSNGVSAIQTLRKGKVGNPPDVDVRRDYEIFLERNDGYATASALKCEVTADAFFVVAELLLKSGDDAVARAELLLGENPPTPDLTFDVKARLDAAQQRALQLVRLSTDLVARLRMPAAAEPRVHGRAFKANFLRGLVKSNALSGLQVLSDDVVSDPPVVSLDADFRAFARRNEEIAGREGLDPKATADAAFLVVSLLLDTAEQAGKDAEALIDF